jgi:hypothetical protein
MTVRDLVAGLVLGALLAGLGPPSASGQSVGSDAIERRALEMVDRYVSALAQGHVAEIQALLGARAWGRRKDALERDPAYRQFLIERYRGATYTILGRSWPDPDTLAVDLRILLASSEEEVVTRLLFATEKGRLVLAGETDPGL